MVRDFPDYYIRWNYRAGNCTEVKSKPKRPRFYYEPPWWKRWRPGDGAIYKKAFHKAKRQALRKGQARKSVAGYTSTCKWKGY